MRTHHHKPSLKIRTRHRPSPWGRTLMQNLRLEQPLVPLKVEPNRHQLVPWDTFSPGLLPWMIGHAISIPAELVDYHWVWTGGEQRISIPFFGIVQLPRYLFETLYGYRPERIHRTCGHDQCVSPFHHQDRDYDKLFPERSTKPALVPTVEQSLSDEIVDLSKQIASLILRKRLGGVQEIYDFTSQAGFSREETDKAISLMDEAIQADIGITNL